MSKKNCEPNQNLSKLISQVRVLSKAVDELEKEIEDLKLKICRNKNKKPRISPNEPKKVSVSGKSSLFRLKFFRKTDKTKENGTPTESSKETVKKDESIRDAISSNTPPSLRQPSIKKSDIDDSNEVVKSKRKNDFTQTSNPSTQIIRPKAQRQVQVKYSKSDTCPCNSRGNKSNNSKKSKIDTDKAKRKTCSNDCPYLPKNLYNDKDESTSRKPVKNKKLMVNLIGSNRDFKNQTKKHNNFVLDCKFLQNADFTKLMNSKDERRGKKIKLFGNDSRESRSLKKDCKQCSSNYKTKNVLKIKKAILTQEPPMILVSPGLEKGKIRCRRRKLRKKSRDLEVCCDDSCPSAEGARVKSSDCFECPCSAFAASISARYDKLCQTEISRK